MQNYPIVHMIVRYGGWFAAILALVPLAVGLYLMLATGGWLFLLGGVVASAIFYVLLKSYVELVCIIADMLLVK